jgi:cytochrome d ubiquinol oxidase subunit II
VIAALSAAYLAHTEQEGWGFTASAVAIGVVLVSMFACLYPHVMVSSTNSAYNLTVSNSSSAHYALTVMTIVAVLLTPVVLLYQGWSYHVFKARVTSTPDQAPDPAVSGEQPMPPPTAAAPGS